MQDLSRNAPTAARRLRAGVAVRGAVSAASRKRGATLRTPGGRKAATGVVWRRCEMGTNHIACFGVWRRGTRRQAVRNDRCGQTRWHMPHRDGAAILLPGAVRESVNQD
ncbi:MAG TPA: hypothetical protein VNU97_18920 [Rhizomicrobium sp.]|jgi:hypothetical protein|nr:hypothetical protein [Rhizomicrobium sp.]